MACLIIIVSTLDDLNWIDTALVQLFIITAATMAVDKTSYRGVVVIRMLAFISINEL